MKIPFKCPICDGTGNVPGGYYTRVGVNTWGFTSVAEPCRQCNATGIVIIEQDDQQTSAKDKEIAELKEAISELIQVKDWKDKYGKDEHYLKAMPTAWENVRKLIQK